MKTMLAVSIILLLTACQNMDGYSPAYQAAHEKAFWAELSGGGTDGGAQAWANLKAHQEAERVAGK